MQVHEMYVMVQRVNGFDIDRQLVHLQSELIGTKARLHRMLEETQGRVRYPPRHGGRCRQTGGGSIETRQIFTQARSSQIKEHLGGEWS